MPVVEVGIGAFRLSLRPEIAGRPGGYEPLMLPPELPVSYWGDSVQDSVVRRGIPRSEMEGGLSQQPPESTRACPMGNHPTQPDRVEDYINTSPIGHLELSNPVEIGEPQCPKRNWKKKFGNLMEPK